MYDFQINVMFSNNHMIDIEAVTDETTFFITLVYRDLVLERRDQIYEHLTCFSIIRSRPWFIMEDFNEITGQNEKKGADNALIAHFCLLRKC